MCVCVWGGGGGGGHVNCAIDIAVHGSDRGAGRQYYNERD